MADAEKPAASLDGKVVLVTGAGAGIGRSLAIGLAGYGARVAVLARQAAAGEAVRDEISQAHGPDRATAITGNVTVERDARAAVAATVQAFGRLDVLVNNAAITPNVRILDMPFEDFMHVQRTNLGGQFVMSQAAAPTMIEQRRGRIINLTSGRGVVGAPGLAAYSASKAAINNLTGVLHLELAEYGIRTVAVAPGLIDTPGMRSAVGAEHIVRVTATYPGGKPGSTEGLVGLFAFLASDGADDLSGTVVTVRL